MHQYRSSKLFVYLGKGKSHMVIPSHSIVSNLILSSKVLGKLSPEDFATFCHEQKDLRIGANR